MKLIRWTFAGRGRLRAYVDIFPNSTVHLSKIRGFYFVHHVQWDEWDPIVENSDLKEIERLVNEEMETINAYNKRRNASL